MRGETWRGGEEHGDDFWKTTAVDVEAYEARHGFGPEADEPSVIERRRKEASTILEKMRRNPLAKPLLRMLALIMGVGGIGLGTMRSRETVDAQTVETAAEDPGVEYELRRLIFDELLERGEVLLPYEVRYGREGWSQEEKLEYNDIPTLTGRFEYLHKASPDLVRNLRDPKGRVQNFEALFTVMSLEFERSSLPFVFAKGVVKEAPQVFIDLVPTEAVQQYATLSTALAKHVGLSRVRELARGCLEKLPANHPIVTQVKKDGLLDKKFDAWFAPGLVNTAVFDQVSGRVEIYHRDGKRMVLLEAFPGNGGPASGVAWEPGLPGHVVARTPDGEFTFDRMLEKKSPSWQASWVGDTAKLRWAQDRENVEYQDQDGAWRLLTGEDAEFVVYGAPQKPFREKTRSNLYREASHRLPTGELEPPRPFRVEDALGDDGELREVWDRNDFGPKSIRMKNARGELMSVFFHSSPLDESPEAVLDASHGCIHMKPGDIEAMGGYLKRGSKIRISSVDEMAIVAMN